jgi:hypothetical protein
MNYPLKWGFCIGEAEKSMFCEMLNKVASAMGFWY